MIKTNGNRLLAGAFSGLYSFDYKKDKWVSVTLPVKEKNIVDIIQKQDTIFILTRSFLLKTTDLFNFSVSQLPPPENYDNKSGLFKTLWVIHSDEIYGIAGKIIVDFAGLVFAFLTITGFIVFINRIILKKKIKPAGVKIKLKNSIKWNIKWHNKIGWIALVSYKFRSYLTTSKSGQISPNVKYKTTSDLTPAIRGQFDKAKLGIE